MAHDCCSSEECETESIKQVSNTVVCPSCEQKGKKVKIQTLQAMLAVTLEAIDHSTTYRFCRSADCPVVYFGEGGDSFVEEDLREQVYQKHPESEDIFVCYCYRHSPGTIRSEILERGETDVVARVTAGTKAGTCACDIRNPQGSCCLGNVRAAVKQVEESLGTEKQAKKIQEAPAQGGCCQSK